MLDDPDSFLVERTLSPRDPAQSEKQHTSRKLVFDIGLSGRGCAVEGLFGRQTNTLGTRRQLQLFFHQLAAASCKHLLRSHLRLPISRLGKVSAMASTPPIVVPENHTLHKENSAYLLLPTENGAFLNTIQEFNRDLSVACIRTWTERYSRDKLARFQNRKTHPARKRRKLSAFRGLPLIGISAEVL